MENLEDALNAMPGSELNSLLLRIFRARSQRCSAAQVFEEWRVNPLYRLPTISPLRLRALEDICLKHSPGFELVELPPIAPLGAVSTLGLVSQNNVFSALRGAEVVADSTNLLALEAASRRKRDPSREARLSAIHRLARAQKFRDPSYMAHFKVFSMITAGKDRGRLGFEQCLLEHVGTYRSILAEYAPEARCQVILYSQSRPPVPGWAEAIVAMGCEVNWSEKRKSGNGYYPGYSFYFGIETSEGSLPVADGGFVDWTQKLAANQKERLMISGTGLDLLASRLARP